MDITESKRQLGTDIRALLDTFDQQGGDTAALRAAMNEAWASVTAQRTEYTYRERCAFVEARHLGVTSYS